MTVEELLEIEEIKRLRIMYLHYLDGGDLDGLGGQNDLPRGGPRSKQLVSAASLPQRQADRHERSTRRERSRCMPPMPSKTASRPASKPGERGSDSTCGTVDQDLLTRLYGCGPMEHLMDIEATGSACCSTAAAYP